MRCPSCDLETSASNSHCIHCGAALHAPSTRPKQVPGVFYDFVRSPLIIIAIIAYTVYAAILTFHAFPALGSLGSILLLIKVSFFLALSLGVAVFVFIPVVFLVIGLWRMVASAGERGSEMVSSSIKVYVLMNAVVLISLFLAVISTDGAMDALSFLGAEFLFLALAISGFSLVAIYSLSRFAAAVGYTANYDEANTDGLLSCGVMVLIYAGLGLISFLISGTANVTSSLSGSSMDSATFSSILYMIAMLLFGISVLVYNSRISQAEVADFYYEELERQKEEKTAPKATPSASRPAYQAAAAPVAAPTANSDEKIIDLLKQYKELLDTGVITQEEFDKKKSQLLK